jgi:hypothetical protein
MWSARHSQDLRRKGFEGTQGLSSYKLQADRCTGCSRYFGSCKTATKDTLSKTKCISESSSCTVRENTIPEMAAVKGGFSSPPLRINWAVTEPPPALPPQMVICGLSVVFLPEGSSHNVTHLVWVAAESRDMSRYPLYSGPLVKQSSIRCTIFSNLFAGQEAVRSKSVLNRHKDDAAVRGADEVGPASISTIANCVTTTVDRQQYWQALVRSVRRSEHIKHQTVFAGRYGRRSTTVESGKSSIPGGQALHALWALRGCIQNFAG